MNIFESQMSRTKLAQSYAMARNEHEVKRGAARSPDGEAEGQREAPDEAENAAQLGFKKNPVEFQEKSS